MDSCCPEKLRKEMDGKALLDSTISTFAHDYASAIEYMSARNNEADCLQKQAAVRSARTLRMFVLTAMTSSADGVLENIYFAFMMAIMTS